MLGGDPRPERLELAGESVQAALEALAAVAPGWLAGVIDGSWQQVYGQRIDNLRLPASEATRKKLAGQYAGTATWGRPRTATQESGATSQPQEPPT